MLLARTLKYLLNFKGGDFWVWSLRRDAHLYGVWASTSHHLQWDQVNKYFMHSSGKYKALIIERIKYPLSLDSEGLSENMNKMQHSFHCFNMFILLSQFFEMI